ncbi:MAG: hypothetical protein CVU05_05545 [Bacteroidetes bacterium HGW-Bacteroidetes-21]|jgi:hypothetical protein|nr:MAG: hypothetical protein CVU05_05545 [Bacteroidetes bacterium HGW-Bacteroidetes-21]
MKNLLVILTLSFFAVGIVTSCKKDKAPKAVVTVKNLAGQPVAGAIVKIYSDPRYYNDVVVSGTDTVHMYDPVGYYDPDNRVLYDEKSTNSAGQTEHEFKYESIYNVIVKLPVRISHNVYDTLYGEGALILKMNETYQETITIR